MLAHGAYLFARAMRAPAIPLNTSEEGDWRVWREWCAVHGERMEEQARWLQNEAFERAIRIDWDD